MFLACFCILACFLFFLFCCTVWYEIVWILSETKSLCKRSYSVVYCRYCIMTVLDCILYYSIAFCMYEVHCTVYSNHSIRYHNNESHHQIIIVYPLVCLLCATMSPQVESTHQKWSVRKCAFVWDICHIPYGTFFGIFIMLYTKTVSYSAPALHKLQYLSKVRVDYSTVLSYNSAWEKAYCTTVLYCTVLYIYYLYGMVLYLDDPWFYIGQTETLYPHTYSMISHRTMCQEITLLYDTCNTFIPTNIVLHCILVGGGQILYSQDSD